MKSGLVYGAMMFVTMGIVFPYVDGEEITVKNLAIAVVVWALAGLAFGYTMKKFFDKQKAK